MSSFWIGFLSGIGVGLFAGFMSNWGYVMFMRLLPATYSRYPVKIEDTRIDSVLENLSVKAKVKIGPPIKRRALMEPLIEDLAVKLKLDGGEWIDGSWATGVDETYFTANRTTVAYISLLETGSKGYQVYLSNKFPDDQYLIPKDGMHLLEVKIVRVIDEKEADMKTFTFVLRDKTFISIS